MKLGLWLTAQHPAGLPPGRAVREHLEQVATARDLGFDVVLAGQHFLPEPYWMLQNIPFLARMTAESGTMRIGSGITLLSLLNPLEVAENYATLAALAGGPVVAGFGLGYRTVENRAFGVETDRAAVFRRKLQVVKDLLAGKPVTASGPGYTLEDAELTLVPALPTEYWIAANSDRAVQSLARDGDVWFVNPHSALSTVGRQVDLYLQQRAASGHGPFAGLPIARELCVRPTDAEAARVVRPFIQDKYDRYVTWGQDHTMPAGETLAQAFDDLADDGRFIVGSPETCAATIATIRGRIAVSDLVLRVQWPGFPQREALRSLELFVEQVVPLLDRP